MKLERKDGSPVVGCFALCAIVGFVAQMSFGGTASTFDSDTFAFYPFDEGTVGEFQADQYNAVDRESFAGTAYKNPNNVANSTTRMSDEAPGKYVFAGRRQTADRLVYTEPRSLRLGSGTFYSDKSASTYGYFEVPTASVELSKHHDTGFTVEFFFKLNPEDGWYANSYQVGFDAGFCINGGSNNARIKALLPTRNEYETRLVVNSTSTGANNKDIVAATDVRTKVSGFTSFKDGQWHHFAFVKEAGAIKYYIDRALVGSGTLENLGLTTQEISSGYFNIGRVGGNEYSFGAAISCLRFSKVALSVDGFLSVGDEVHPSDVIAGYAFCDGAAGTSAAGSGVLKNMVDRGSNSGSVTLDTTAGANASATFDADIPAPYVYFGKRARGSVPVYSNPQSVKVTSDVTGKAAEIAISRLGTEISKLHGDGWTFEYFVKYLDEKQASFAPAFFSCECGYPKNGKGNSNFRFYMPVAVNDTWRKSIAYSLGSREDAGTPMFYYQKIPFDYLTDQAWHHVAVVAQSKSADGGVKISAWVDGGCYGSITIASAEELAVDKPLVLCHGKNYHVKLACVTLRKGAKTSAEFLKGYRTPGNGGMLLIFR